MGLEVLVIVISRYRRAAKVSGTVISVYHDRAVCGKPPVCEDLAANRLSATWFLVGPPHENCGNDSITKKRKSSALGESVSSALRDRLSRSTSRRWLPRETFGCMGPVQRATGQMLRWQSNLPGGWGNVLGGQSNDPRGRRPNVLGGLSSSPRAGHRCRRGR